MVRTHLGECIGGYDHVILGLKAKARAVGMAALEDKLPGARGEQEAAFLLHQSNALGARPWRKRMRDETVEEDAAGERLERTRNQLEESGFPASVRSEDGHDFAGLGVEAEGLESKERRLGGVGRVGVADLLDAEAYVRSGACLLRRGDRRAKWDAHVSLLRSK